jgi:hypothetical protein
MGAWSLHAPRSSQPRHRSHTHVNSSRPDYTEDEATNNRNLAIRGGAFREHDMRECADIECHCQELHHACARLHHALPQGTRALAHATPIRPDSDLHNS